MDKAVNQPVYFIGITLPPELDKQISDLQWLLHERDKSTLKPLLPHVTLLHPPSLKGIMPDELLPKVHKVAERYMPLAMACESIGFFGHHIGYIRAQSHSLYSLQTQLVKLLPPMAQVMHYRRQYLPHITLVQAYQPHTLDIEKLQKIIGENLTLPMQFTVSSVTCFRRILPRQYRAQPIE